MQKNDDNRNLVLALVLSTVVFAGWQYFYGLPKIEQDKQQAAQQQALQAANAPQSQALGAASPISPPTRNSVVSASPRVSFENSFIKGSIRTQGARIDDLTLLHYHETVDKKSPNITYLSPEGTKDAYYAEFGYVPAVGSNVAILPSATSAWKVTSSNAKLELGKPLQLAWDNGQGLAIKRTITLDDKYLFSVKDELTNATAAPIATHAYGLIRRHGEPKLEHQAVLHEGFLGVFANEGFQEKTYATINEKGTQRFSSRTGWLAVTDKYWAAALLPDQKTNFNGSFASSVSPEKLYQTDYMYDAVTIAPNTSATITHALFAGAKEVKTVEGYKSALSVEKFDLLIDWGWFYIITKPMFYLIDFLYGLVKNFGIAILLTTIVVRGVLFPLAQKSYESMVKMKKIQPEFTAVREKFATDKMAQQQAMMALYKEHKINPVAGCLPVLLQIPIFFALYKVLFISIEMRHSPFFGWIQDLAAPDPTNLFNLFGLLPFSPPAFLALGIWPLIMGVTMFVQMKMNPAPPDKTQEMIFNYMPLLFMFMMATFPAGLVIYWSWSNILSIAQQWVMMRKYGVEIELFGNLKKMFKLK